MEAFDELKRGVHAALESYSNIHRGSGYNSMVTTHLFEQAREIVLEYLGLDKGKYIVVFCTPQRAETLKAVLKPESYRSVSSLNIGLPLGLRAMAIRKNTLPKGKPFQTGGGTARLVSTGWVVWANSPDKFEAGTPAIVNVIAFAKALLLTKHFGINSFHEQTNEKHTAANILFHDKLEQYSGREMLGELRKTLIGSNVSVPTVEGIKRFTNLDNAASTPTFEPIWDAVCQTWSQPLQVQQEIISEVKSICGEVLGAPLAEYDMIFTSNTTEAINLVADSLRNETGNGFEPVVLNTILEHNSNDLPWRTKGISLIRLNVDNEGFVDLNELAVILAEYNQKCEHGKKRIKLVAVSGASNVLGVFNDISEISRIVHQYGACMLVDAAQLVAHRKISMEECGIDYLAFSAHKMYAPFGSGLLVAKKDLLSFSSTKLEQIKSSGEENSGGIAALGKALLLLQRIGFDAIQKEEHALTVRVLQGLSEIEGLEIFGIKDPDSPDLSKKGGVFIFEIKGVFANEVANKLAEQGGIGVRSGCHCAHIIIKHLLKISQSLERFQRLIVILFPKVNLPGLTRISLGLENTEEDVDTLINELRKITASTNKATPVLSHKEIQQQIRDFAKTVEVKVYG